MPITNHAGFEGVTTAKGVDRHIDKWQLTETTKDQPNTTTADFDAVTGRCFERSLPTTVRTEGSFEFPWDSTADPYPDLQTGSQVPLVLVETTGHTWNFTSVLITTYDEDQGGIDGLFRIKIGWKSQSKYVKT